MPLSEELITDFIDRYERAFGEKLSSDQGEIMAGRLLHLYSTMLGIRRREGRSRKLEDPKRPFAPSEDQTLREAV